MINKYTHQDALAYVAITGSTKALHERTLRAVKREIEKDDAGRYKPKKEVRPTAQKSRLWKAHAWLTEKGFSLADFTGPGELEYSKRGAHAVTGRHGAVYVRGSEKVRFLNG